MVRRLVLFMVSIYFLQIIIIIVWSTHCLKKSKLIQVYMRSVLERLRQSSLSSFNKINHINYVGMIPVFWVMQRDQNRFLGIFRGWFELSSNTGITLQLNNDDIVNFIILKLQCSPKNMASQAPIPQWRRSSIFPTTLSTPSARGSPLWSTADKMITQVNQFHACSPMPSLLLL